MVLAIIFWIGFAIASAFYVYSVWKENKLKRPPCSPKGETKEDESKNNEINQ